MEANSSSGLPPGFRFHPTDEELIVYYLKNQAISKPCPVSIIPEVDIYKFDPWQLPEKAEFGENEWYFFSPRDRKYPNGVRPNRATVSGYWKATGTDKAIHSASKYVGVKKALVFYKGRPPKGIKTDWIMHEYRLSDSKRQATKQLGSMRLDDWVLCRIYKKRHVNKAYMDPKLEDSSPQMDHFTANDVKEEQGVNFPRNFSFSSFLDMDYLGPISQLLNENPTYDFQNMLATNAGLNGQTFQFGDQIPYQSADSGKFQVMNQSNSTFNQPLFVNPAYNNNRHVNKAYMDPKLEDSSPQIDHFTAANDVKEEHGVNFPRNFSISSFLDMDYLGPISQLLNENPTYDFQNMLASNAGLNGQTFQYGDQIPYQSADSGKFQLMNQSNSTFNQPLFVNPAYNNNNNMNGLNH